MVYVALLYIKLQDVLVAVVLYWLECKKKKSKEDPTNNFSQQHQSCLEKYRITNKDCEIKSY